MTRNGIPRVCAMGVLGGILVAPRLTPRSPMSYHFVFPIPSGNTFCMVTCSQWDDHFVSHLTYGHRCTGWRHFMGRGSEMKQYGEDDDPQVHGQIHV